MRDQTDSRTLPLSLGLTQLELQTDVALGDAALSLRRAKRVAMHYCGDQFEAALEDAIKGVEFALSMLHGTSVDAERAKLLSAFSLPFEEAARGEIA